MHVFDVSTLHFRFAQLALSMDLKPGKVAVQLSNDLCRLFPIQLRRFGAGKIRIPLCLTK